MARSNKRQREKLFHAQGRRCYYCHVEMRNDWDTFTYIAQNGQRKVDPNKQLPENMATLEHLDSRLSPLRGTFPPNVRRHVVACRMCNNRRGIQEQAQLSMEDLHERSQRH